MLGGKEIRCELPTLTYPRMATLVGVFPLEPRGQEFDPLSMLCDLSGGPRR